MSVTTAETAVGVRLWATTALHPGKFSLSFFLCEVQP